MKAFKEVLALVIGIAIAAALFFGGAALDLW